MKTAKEFLRRLEKLWLSDVEPREYVELENELFSEYREKLSAFFDEVDLIWIDDVTLRLGRKYTDTRVHVYFYYLPGERIDVQDFPRISEDRTPFAWALLRELNLGDIRPVLMPVIQGFILEIAEAEHEGRLAEKIEEVERELKADLWIPEFRDLLSALERVKEEIKR